MPAWFVPSKLLARFLHTSWVREVVQMDSLMNCATPKDPTTPLQLCNDNYHGHNSINTNWNCHLSFGAKKIYCKIIECWQFFKQGTVSGTKHQRQTEMHLKAWLAPTIRIGFCCADCSCIWIRSGCIMSSGENYKNGKVTKNTPKTAAPINLKPSFWVVHQIIQKKNTNVHHHFAPWPHTHQGFLPMLGSRDRDQGFSFMIPCDCSLFSRCIHGAKKKPSFVLNDGDMRW